MVARGGSSRRVRPEASANRKGLVDSASVPIYTRSGDDGTTGLLFGGRVRKDAAPIELLGAVDEAQAALGVARAEMARGGELDRLLVDLERDLWVLMAEVATAPRNRKRLVPGTTLVTEDMVAALEQRIDEVSARHPPPAEFVVPGQSRVSALLDQARTVVRRAERQAGKTGVSPQGSLVVPYLNRLSDLVWVLARGQDGEHLAARQVAQRSGLKGRTRAGKEA
jgi:cob(I)alamin adenosyltransferase